MKTSLLISTYNRPDALRLCLLSAFQQSVMPDEIIIGDDGSDERTQAMIDNLRPLCPVPLIHVWQEDCGYRLAMMRNKSVAVSSGDYLIEVDGDVILHRDFVKDHISFARKGFYLKGGRTNLGRKLTERLCEAGRPAQIRWWTYGIEGKAENALHLPSVARRLAPRYRRNKESALGCNMSFFRDDFKAINGYDEFFEGWGGEDGDFGRRLQAYGIKKLHLKFAGIVYHLWHEDRYMYNKDKNIMYSCRQGQPVRCENGFDKYIDDTTSTFLKGH